MLGTFSHLPSFLSFYEVWNRYNLAFAYFGRPKSLAKGTICDTLLIITSVHNIQVVFGSLESSSGKKWPKIAWNDGKLAQNPLNLVIAYFGWPRPLPVGIICDISMSIVCFYNIWSVLGCLESFGGKNWPQIAWNDGKLAKKSLKFSSCLLKLIQVSPSGYICDISMSIVSFYNI